MAKKAVPVFAVSGSEDFLRERDLAGIVDDHRKKGWRLDRVVGVSSGELRAAMSQDSLSFMTDDVPTLVVVEQADKVDIGLLERHAGRSATSVVLLLRHEGDPKENTKIGKFLKDLGKQHRNWPKSKEWDADKVAVEFVIKEFQALGKTIPVRLAEIFVARVGTELGFLSFEVSKISALSDAVGKSEVDPDLVKGGMAPLAEATVQPVVEALARKDAKALAGHLDKLKRTTKDDQTIRLVRVLFDSVSKWLAVAEFRDRGVGHDAAAAELGVNPWFWKNKVVPQAGAWTRADAASLMGKLGDAERNVRAGGVNPWAFLVSSLLSACAVGGR